MAFDLIRFLVDKGLFWYIMQLVRETKNYVMV